MKNGKNVENAMQLLIKYSKKKLTKGCASKTFNACFFMKKVGIILYHLVYNFWVFIYIYCEFFFCDLASVE
jgi:hypothetical protein